MQINTGKDIMAREVVVILPFSGEKVLMQLRDFKPEIMFPGAWGFFGGSINEGESAQDAARRELQEEIGYMPKALHLLSVERILGYILVHAYYCALDRPVDELVLSEGLDLGLFSLTEVMRDELYSARLGRAFPAVGTPYAKNIIKKLFTHLEGQRNSL